MRQQSRCCGFWPLCTTDKQAVHDRHRTVDPGARATIHLNAVRAAIPSRESQTIHLILDGHAANRKRRDGEEAPRGCTYSSKNTHGWRGNPTDAISHTNRPFFSVCREDCSFEKIRRKRELRMTRIRADGPVHLVRIYPRVSASSAVKFVLVPVESRAGTQWSCVLPQMRIRWVGPCRCHLLA